MQAFRHIYYIVDLPMSQTQQFHRTISDRAHMHTYLASLLFHVVYQTLFGAEYLVFLFYIGSMHQYHYAHKFHMSTHTLIIEVD